VASDSHPVTSRSINLQTKKNRLPTLASGQTVVVTCFTEWSCYLTGAGLVSSGEVVLILSISRGWVSSGAVLTKFVMKVMKPSTNVVSAGGVTTSEPLLLPPPHADSETAAVMAHKSKIFLMVLS
jgi:hypothetical protein